MTVLASLLLLLAALGISTWRMTSKPIHAAAQIITDTELGVNQP